MDYELAKRLKDAGFNFRKVDPRHIVIESRFGEELGEDTNVMIFGFIKAVAFNKEWFYVPILEELISACGDGFFQLQNFYDVRVWVASMMGKMGRGKTPSEAVANLWISLNKK